MSTTLIKHVLVVGYYDHDNLGDEQYKSTILFLLKRVFQKRLLQPEIVFVDCDRLTNYTMVPGTVVILGGGDVLNTYFLDKMYHRFVTKCLNDPAAVRPSAMIALSVGIPYDDVYKDPVKRPRLEIFDYIFLRTRQDIEVLRNYITADKVHYLPDTSCLALEYVSTTTQYKMALTRPFRTFYEDIQRRGTERRRKIIGVMLCRHIYHPDTHYRSTYQTIVNEFARLLEQLIQSGYFVVMVPFNTKSLHGRSPDMNSENDVLIQRDVMKQMGKHALHQVVSIEFGLTLEQTMLLYKLFYMTIPMRFHATLFSVYSGVPMIPVYTTKKIRNFLLDIHWKYGHRMERNAKDLPVSFNRAEWLSSFHALTHTAAYLTGKKQLLNTTYEFKQIVVEQVGFLRMALETAKTRPAVLDVLDSPCDTSGCREVAVQHPVTGITETLLKKLQRFAQEHGAADFRQLRDPMLKQVAVSVVSYYLTGRIDSVYNDGLMQKMFDPDLTYVYTKEWKWVWEHNHANNTSASPASTDFIPPSPAFGMRFNIEYIDQNDRSGVHRSGWKYVYDALRSYHDPCGNRLLLDLYVDRTFHWKRSIYREIDVLPYTQPWVGFVHHTFDTEFSPYNNCTLMQCPEFVQSLSYCKGLIVLSKTLQHQFVQRIPNDVPVYVLTHPTEINVPSFQYVAFMNNPDKKLLHVGGWLRNVFSFYQMELNPAFKMVHPSTEWKKVNKKTGPASPTAPIAASDAASSSPSPLVQESFFTRCMRCFLPRREALNIYPMADIAAGSVPPTTTATPTTTTQICVTTTMVQLRKVVLKGKNMNNYLPPPNVWEQFTQTTKTEPTSHEQYASASPSPSDAYCSTGVTTTLISNNWVKHMVDYLQRICHNVDVMEYTDNPEFDDLLTKNVVFLNLVDGSAINTLLECFVRNTPVFVNRHPAAVEVLGEQYPMYYNRPSDVNTLLQQPQLIFNTHVYLKKQDKTPYKIETFLAGLNHVLTPLTHH